MELKARFNPKKHNGYIICRRLNKITYINKEARPNRQQGWFCGCGQMTKLDPYYHDVFQYIEYGEDWYPEEKESAITDKDIAKSPMATYHMKYWTGAYPDEIEHDYTFDTKKILLITKVTELCKKFNANIWVIFNNKHRQIHSGEKK